MKNRLTQNDSQQYYAEDKRFLSVDFSNDILLTGTYERCKFDGCIFPQYSLAECNFVDCEMKNCDLSNLSPSGTSFRGVYFSECKLLGTRFEVCNPLLLTVRFAHCNLSLASFHKLPLKQTEFIECEMKETDFTACELTNALFDNCNLAGTKFERANLEKADLRSAYNYSIDPENTRITKAKFSAAGLPGLLTKYGIRVY